MEELELLPLSYSKLSGYRDCPKRCKEEPYTTNPMAIIGDIAHKAMASVHRGDEALAREMIRAETVKNGLTREQSADLNKMFEETVSNPRYNIERERIITIESDDGETMLYGKPYFLVPLPIVVDCADGKKKRIALRGAFDLAIRRQDPNDGIEIRDYKSGFGDADDFQADIYALAAFLKYWRTAPIYTTFIYIRKGFASKPAKYTEGELVSVLEYVSILASAFAKETEWASRFNSGCRHCSLRIKCDEYQEKISKSPEKQEIDPENWNAIQAWKEQMNAISKVAESFLDDVKEKEKAYLRTHGPQLVGNGTKEASVYEEVSRYDIPVETVSTLLKNSGIEPTQALSFSSGKIDSLICDAQIKGKITAIQGRQLAEQIDNLKTVSAYKQIVRAKPVKK
jgi:hypothetical protein